MSFIRHPDFDAITMGWGSDGRVDLAARIALLREHEEAHHLNAAELKIKAAMGARLVKLTLEATAP